MSKKDLKKAGFPENTEFKLERAEPFKNGSNGFSFSMLLALSYLGIFASIICEFMVIMSALSRSDHAINYNVMAGGVIAFVVRGAASILFTVLENKAKKKLEQERTEALNSIEPVEGKITAVNRYIRRILHGGNVYEESLWTFNIEYYDEEKNETAVIESEKYLNDVTEVLSGDTVKIYFKPDKGFELSGFELRKSNADDKTELPVNEKVVSEESVLGSK